MQNTLWPETQKLYGHDNEVYAIASSPDGKIIASACKASNSEHAEIILWNSSTWKQQQQLQGHNLTVTQLKFSPNEKYLLSVSRDRKWCLFENHKLNEGGHDFQLKQILEKKNIHSRIIWTCDWSHDSELFVTGSRDGKVIVWKSVNNSFDVLSTFTLKNDSITAISFGYTNFNGKMNQYLIAVGLESGQIHLYTVSSVEKSEWLFLATIPDEMSHHLTVKKLAFRPVSDGRIQLASCGVDHLVRINEIVVEG